MAISALLWLALLFGLGWLWIRCYGRRGMASKPVGDEEGEPQEPLPSGRTSAGGLWVADGGPAHEERRTHPLYKKLSSLSKDVSALSRGQLKQRLRELNMEPRFVGV